MQKKHNFGAGPCILPQEVLRTASQAVLNWDGTGLSILEISHRSEGFKTVMDTTRQLIRELLKVPDSYEILFLQGGASTQFSMIPLNFLEIWRPGVFLDTGFFSRKAIKEAEHFGEVTVVASSQDKDYSYIPDDYEIPAESSFFHCTSNNTIEGTQMNHFPDSPVPLFCDMSSDIFSRYINVRDFDLIYAGAQKNMGPAGLTLVIVKNELLGPLGANKPAMWDYRTYREHKSLYNTAPVFSIYVTMLNLMWLKGKGIEDIWQQNIAKAKALYQEIDRNSLFYGFAHPPHRSMMNVTFKMHDTSIEAAFLAYAEEKGMVGISGFPTMGGFRVSLYNALRLSSVMELIHCMQAFENIQLKNIQATTANS